MGKVIFSLDDIVYPDPEEMLHAALDEEPRELGEFHRNKILEKLKSLR